MTAPSRATPLVTDLTRPFWDATQEGRLVVQRCAQCAYYNHPPKAACDNCQSTNLGFEAVAGKGAVWTYTVMHQKSVAGFEEAVPYLTALVELDEQPMLLMVSNLPGLTPEDVQIGMRVQVTFEALEDGNLLPQFIAEGDLSPSPKPVLSSAEGSEKGPGGEVS